MCNFPRLRRLALHTWEITLRRFWTSHRDRRGESWLDWVGCDQGLVGWTRVLLSTCFKNSSKFHSAQTFSDHSSSSENEGRLGWLLKDSGWKLQPQRWEGRPKNNKNNNFTINILQRSFESRVPHICLRILFFFSEFYSGFMNMQL